MRLLGGCILSLATELVLAWVCVYSCKHECLCARMYTGNRVLTASSDRTARLWDVNTGECVQVLDGHSDEIFSCAFNYNGDTIITGAALASLSCSF